jgi:hypothetical protein
MTNNLELVKNNSTLLIDILAKNVILKGESVKKLNKIKEEVLTELAPGTVIERLLVGKIIADYWKLQRLLKFESRILLYKQDQYAKNDSEKKYDPYFIKLKQEGKKFKRFRRKFEQIEYSQQVEEIQKHISIVEAGLHKSISEYQNIQKARLQK